MSDTFLLEYYSFAAAAARSTPKSDSAVSVISDEEMIQIFEEMLEEKPDFVKFIIDLKEENKQLKAENKELGEQIAALRQQTCCCPGEKLEDRIGEIIETKNKYRAEVEKLAETADNTPDRCEMCDTRFDLHYTMNHCDKELRKKYDDYFGSEDDDGDLCPTCLLHHYHK